MCTTDSRDPVGLIQAGLAVLLDTDVVTCPDETVRAELVGLLRVANLVQAAIWARVASFDARDLACVDGLRTTRMWLCAVGHLSPHAATGLVQRATVLRQLPAVAAATTEGSVTGEHVAKLVTLVEQVGPGPARAVDTVLAQVAATGTPAQLQQACDRIRDHADPDGPPPDPAAERRGITLARVGDLVRVKGQLDLEAGALLHTALDALMPPPTPDDLRTPAQRRADALTDLARLPLHQGALPTVGGVRPHIGLLITPDTLTTAPVIRDQRAALLRLLDQADANRAHTRQTPTRPDPDPVRGETGTSHHHAGPNAGTNASAATDRGATDRGATDRGATDRGAAERGATDRGAASRDHRTARAGTTGHGAAVDGAAGNGAARNGAAGNGAAADGAAGTHDRPDPLKAAGIAPLPDPPWLDWVGPVPTTTAQRLACDSVIYRILYDPATGQPLDVGRAHRTAPTWIRRALYARDHGCRWPGCTTPIQWTDAHHLTPWSQGGHTSIDTMLLLCRWHHVIVHEGQWTLAFDPMTGEVTITRPNGQPYELGPSQTWLTGPRIA